MVPVAFDFISPAYLPPVLGVLAFDFTVPCRLLAFEFCPELPEPISKALLRSLGLRLYGQVYKYWICWEWRGGQRIRRYVVPYDPKSPSQVALRSKFAAGVLAWQNLSESAKLYWRFVGVRKEKPITSLNAFLSAWMRDKVD